jgi:riboflavin kinase
MASKFMGRRTFIRPFHKYLPVPAPDALLCLKALAQAGALHDFVPVRSGDLAERLGLSQQTASRRLIALEHEGLVQRRGGRQPLLRITPAGEAALRAEAESYARLLAGAKLLRFTGKVAKGFGEGAWYLSRPGYTEPMRRLLGFAPYPGTLNVALEGAEAQRLGELRARDGLLVPEFQQEGRTFGAVKCFRGELRRGRQRVAAAAVLPLRGHHKSVLEVVAAEHLRERFRLQDGDEVTVDIEA